MKSISFRLAMLVIIIAMASCARQVTRISADEQVDLSGRWNDTDSRLVADELTTQVLGQRWIEDFQRRHNGNRPVMIVGLISNKSHEHISAETFIKDIERAIVRNATVRLVQAGEKREELRRERGDQQDFASPETAKKWGRELGADYIMQGTINSIVDQYKKEKVVFYQIDLELTDLETNEIVWMGEKKIKKYINK